MSALIRLVHTLSQSKAMVGEVPTAEDNERVKKAAEEAQQLQPKNQGVRVLCTASSPSPSPTSFALFPTFVCVLFIFLYDHTFWGLASWIGFGGFWGLGIFFVQILLVAAELKSMEGEADEALRLVEQAGQCPDAIIGDCTPIFLRASILTSKVRELDSGRALHVCIIRYENN